MLNKLANSVKVINAFNRFLRWTALSLIYIYNETRVLSLIPHAWKHGLASCMDANQWFDRDPRRGG